MTFASLLYIINKSILTFPHTVQASEFIAEPYAVAEYDFQRKVPTEKVTERHPTVKNMKIPAFWDVRLVW